MKVIIKKISIFFMVLAVMTSCNEEPVEIIDNDIVSLNGMKVIKYGEGKLQKALSGTTLAVFSSQESYDYNIESLEAKVDAWDDAFLAQWGHLDEEALNTKEEELGFDAEKPLTDFENQVGLSSLRKKYLAAEAAWLNNEVLSEVTDPDNDPAYDFDNNEMAVYNKYSEVQIGTTIYKQLSLKEIDDLNGDMKSGFLKRIDPIEEGAVLEIANEDYETLIDYNNGDTSVLDQDNVNIITSTSSGTIDCNIGKSKKAIINTSDDRRIKVLIKARKGFAQWAGKIKSKMKSYKKKNNRWKKWRTYISAGVDGVVRNDLCSPVKVLKDSKKIKKKKKSKYTYKDWDLVYNPKVENGKFKGVYYHNGVIKELILSW